MGRQSEKITHVTASAQGGVVNDPLYVQNLSVSKPDRIDDKEKVCGSCRVELKFSMAVRFFTIGLKSLASNSTTQKVKYFVISQQSLRSDLCRLECEQCGIGHYGKIQVMPMSSSEPRTHIKQDEYVFRLFFLSS